MKSTLVASALALTASGCGPVSHTSNTEASLDGQRGFRVRSATARLSVCQDDLRAAVGECGQHLSERPEPFEAYRSASLRFAVGAPGATMLGSLLYWRRSPKGFEQVTELAQTLDGGALGLATDAGVSGEINVVMGRHEGPGPIEGPLTGTFDASWCSNAALKRLRGASV